MRLAVFHVLATAISLTACAHGVDTTPSYVSDAGLEADSPDDPIADAPPKPSESSPAPTGNPGCNGIGCSGNGTGGAPGPGVGPGRM